MLVSQTVDSRRITAPVAVLADRQCDIAPPSSIPPIYEALGSRDRRLFWYAGENGVGLRHVGLLVVEPQAHRRLWPQLIDWVKARWRLDTTPPGTTPPGRPTRRDVFAR